MYSLKGGERTATSDGVGSWHSLWTTVFSYSCVSSLYILFCVFKMFKIIKSPVLYEVAPCDILFCRQETCLLRHSLENLWRLRIYHVAMCVLHIEGKVHKGNRHFRVDHDSFVWEVFGYSPYSPDLTPSDFHFFCYLKLHLSNLKKIGTTVTQMKF